MKSTIGPKFSQIKDNNVEARTYTCVSRGCRGNGRTFVILKCPFCDWNVTAFVWSLSGGGKRCSCGALFGNLGVAYHFVGMPNKRFCGDSATCTCAREVGYRVCAEREPTL